VKHARPRSRAPYSSPPSRALRRGWLARPARSGCPWEPWLSPVSRCATDDQDLTTRLQILHKLPDVDDGKVYFDRAAVGTVKEPSYGNGVTARGDTARNVLAAGLTTLRSYRATSLDTIERRRRRHRDAKRSRGVRIAGAPPPRRRRRRQQRPVRRFGQVSRDVNSVRSYRLGCVRPWDAAAIRCRWAAAGRRRPGRCADRRSGAGSGSSCP
jgi:hypothetical protein